MPPDVGYVRRPLCFTERVVFSFFWHSDSNLTDDRNTYALIKYNTGLSPWLNSRNSLRHFVHPSLNFTGFRNAKSGIKFGHWGAVVPKRSKISEIWKQIRGTPIKVPSVSHNLSPPRIWYVVRSNHLWGFSLLSSSAVLSIPVGAATSLI